MLKINMLREAKSGGSEKMYTEQVLVEFRRRLEGDYFWLGNQTGFMKEVTFALDGLLK